MAKDIIDAAWASLTPATRGAVRRRFPELFEPAPPPAAEASWPDELDFPDLATEEGRRARLRYLGYTTADIDDGAALILFQLDTDCAALGAWDAETLAMLHGEAFGRMFARRPDPSSMVP